MAIIQFDIRLPNGQRDSAVIDGERALIGSAGYCDVRLPVDQAAAEHVLVEMIGGTLRAEAKTDQPPPTINGMPLTTSPLAPDSVLGIGRVRLFVNVFEDTTEGTGGAAAKKKESNPAAQLALIAMFGAAAYLLLWEDEESIAPAPAEAPVLFAAQAASCPQANPRQAFAFAEEQIALADAKRERMPFHASDGVAAVKLYETAAACYKAGKVDTAAAEATSVATALKQEITNDFRARRLRLNHMLNLRDYELAERDVRVLRALTEGEKGAYVEWLASTEKQLRARSGS